MIWSKECFCGILHFGFCFLPSGIVILKLCYMIKTYVPLICHDGSLLSYLWVESKRKASHFIYTQGYIHDSSASVESMNFRLKIFWTKSRTFQEILLKYEFSMHWLLHWIHTNKMLCRHTLLVPSVISQKLCHSPALVWASLRSPPIHSLLQYLYQHFFPCHCFLPSIV